MADNKKKGLGWRGHVLVTGLMILGLVFIPTSILILVGMLPTIVAALIDRTGTKGMTVGFINFAGVFPYWLSLMQQGHTVDNALNLISDPSVIVFIYLAAAIGYMVEWAVTGLVMSIMEQQGRATLKSIGKRKEELIRRWGEKVTGEITLDRYGFPLESASRDRHFTGSSE